MMLILSIIHSQIVSTNPVPDKRKSSSKSSSSYLKSRKLKSRRRKLLHRQHNGGGTTTNYRDKTCQDVESSFSDKKIVNSTAFQQEFDLKNEVDPVVKTCDKFNPKSEEKIIMVPKRNVAWDLPESNQIELVKGKFYLQISRKL